MEIVGLKELVAREQKFGEERGLRFTDDFIEDEGMRISQALAEEKEKKEQESKDGTE